VAQPCGTLLEFSADWTPIFGDPGRRYQHLAEMELLREGITMRAWGQKEPLLEYRKEAYDMFRNMMANIQNDTVEFLMGVPVEAAVEWAGRRLRSRVSSMRYQWADTTTDIMGQVETYTHSSLKVGRNDPCPCGSGKKYKQCCLRNTM
jgi:preprotein translocase subunit SecA